jgi:hypothetical protein
MKNKFVGIILLTVFLISLVVYGQEQNTSLDNEINAGLENAQEQVQENIGKLPDQSGYGLKIALEKLKLAFIFNKEKRANLELKLANKRLEEAKLMAKENKLEHLIKVKEEHKKLIEKAKNDLKSSGENEQDLEKQSEIENELNYQENKVEDLENTVFVNFKNLNEEQKKKLLELVKGFRQDTNDVKIRVSENKNELRTRLKAKGITEEKLKEKEAKLEEKTERFAKHELEQSQKMYDLASRLIGKFESKIQNTTENETNKFTLSKETLDLNDKAKVKIDESKKALNEKKYKESVLLSRESKKLSVLTIASIRGIKPELIQDKLNFLEDMNKLREDKNVELNKLKEEREKLKDEYKDKIKDLRKEFEDRRK